MNRSAAMVESEDQSSKFMDDLDTPAVKPEVWKEALKTLGLFGCPNPLPRESQASWIFRVSISNGIGVRFLFMDILGETRFDKPKYDPDMEISADKIYQLAVVAKRDKHSFCSRFRMRAFSNYFQVYKHKRPGFLLRPSYAYCPECLAEETPYFRDDWKLREISYCHKHHVSLLDRCQTCEKEIKITRYRLGKNVPIALKPMRNCPECHANLSKHVAVPFTKKAAKQIPRDGNSLDIWVWSKYVVIN